MPDVTSPNFGFVEPEVGASRDTWGTKVNQNFALLDNLLFYAMPIGAILDFAGPNPPPGWLFADGRLISRVTYAALFAVIGTYWGSGDGSTTFGLPATPGRALVCAGTTIDQDGTTLSFSFTQSIGHGNAAIAQTNLPAITLTSDTFAAHSHSGATAPGANHTHDMDVQGSHSHSTDVQGSHTHNAWTSGSDGTHYHGILAHGSGGGSSLADMVGSSPTNQYYTASDGGHGHAIGVDTQGAHSHNISVNGAHQHNNAYSGNLQLGIYADGAHSHQVTLGGGNTPLSLLNPLLVCNKIIYAGQQAASLSVPASPAPTRLRLSSPQRGGQRLIAA
jgi:microcystin-dependent protein